MTWLPVQQGAVARPQSKSAFAAQPFDWVHLVRYKLCKSFGFRRKARPDLRPSRFLEACWWKQPLKSLKMPTFLRHWLLVGSLIICLQKNTLMGHDMHSRSVQPCTHALSRQRSNFNGGAIHKPIRHCSACADFANAVFVGIKHLGLAMCLMTLLLASCNLAKRTEGCCSCDKHNPHAECLLHGLQAS